MGLVVSVGGLDPPALPAYYKNTVPFGHEFAGLQVLNVEILGDPLKPTDKSLVSLKRSLKSHMCQARATPHLPPLMQGSRGHRRD